MKHSPSCSHHISPFSFILNHCDLPNASLQTIFLTLPRACILCVFTQGGIIHLYISRHLRAPWIFKALMFGCLMQLPKQLAITGLPEILPARFSPISAMCLDCENKASFWSLSLLPLGKVFSVDNDLFQFAPHPKSAAWFTYFFKFFLAIGFQYLQMLWHEFNHDPLEWAHMAASARH